MNDIQQQHQQEAQKLAYDLYELKRKQKEIEKRLEELRPILATLQFVSQNNNDNKEVVEAPPELREE